MPNQRMHPAVCSIGNDMYVIGGRFPRNTPQSSVYKYNSLQNTWSTLSPMPTPRIHHGACAIGGFIYVVGGRDGRTRLSSVLRYDPSLDKWTPMASLTHPRSHLAVFVLDGFVYAAGGHDGRRLLSTVEKYEPGLYPDSDSNLDSCLGHWSVAPSMLVPRMHYSAMAWKVEENVFDVMIRQALKSHAQ